MQDPAKLFGNDDEDYSQPDSVDDHEDEDVSLGDISQDEIDRLNKDPEDEVCSATSVQNNDNENDDEAELTPEDEGPRHSSRESVPNVPMNISSMSGQSYFQLDETQRN